MNSDPFFLCKSYTFFMKDILQCPPSLVLEVISCIVSTVQDYTWRQLENCSQTKPATLKVAFGIFKDAEVSDKHIILHYFN